MTPAADKKRLRPAQLALRAGPLLWVMLAMLHPTASTTRGSPKRRTGGSLFTSGSSSSHPSSRGVCGCCWPGFSRSRQWFARAVLFLWMVFFSAFDAGAGIATGVLTRHANSLAGDERVGVDSAIDFRWGDSQLAGGEFAILGNLGHVTWVTFAIAATVALRRAGASRVVVGATFLSVLFATHSGLGAAVGLGAVFVALLLRFGEWSHEGAPRQAPEPA